MVSRGEVRRGVCMKSNDASYDVLVVGTGIAGLSAAVRAVQCGARVMVIERASREERGGNTRWTEALLRMKDEFNVSEDFEDHFAENSGHFLDPSLMREVATSSPEQWSGALRRLAFVNPHIVATLADEAPATIKWLIELGVRFDTPTTYFLTKAQPRIAPVGGGLALVEVLCGWLEERDVRFVYECSAKSLIRNGDGCISGVCAVDRVGAEHRFEAGATVLACGGFEGNPEMLARYVGATSRYMRPVAVGGYFNKGEGLRMALDVGAAPCGDFTQVHAEPLDPRSGQPEPIVLAFSYGILVNEAGERFIDEAPTTVDACYEEVTRSIGRQDGGVAYLILDQKIEDIPNWRRSVRSDQPPIVAESVGDLGAELGVDSETLVRTVREFNAACGEEEDFDGLQLDGCRTKVGYRPKKSNWARTIEKGPFMAFPIICGNCFTFGGVKINRFGQALDLDGDVVPGLYVGGEMIGLYYGRYTGATSVLRGAVFGRLAGDHAARAVPGARNQG